MLGTRFDVLAGTGPARARLDELLTPFCTRRPSSAADHRFAVVDDRMSPEALDDGSWALLADGGVVGRGRDLDEVIALLLTRVNALAITGYAGLAIHAGVVSRAGRVVAFPAASGVGKSTLVAACLASGFDYVSDEALCIDLTSSRVEPYPKPIMLSPSACRMVGLPVVDAGPDEVAVTAGTLGAEVARGDLGLAHVVELVRTDGPPRLVARPAATVMTSLLGMSFNHYRRPRAAFDTAVLAARTASAWRLEYPDPLSGARLLTEHLATDA